MTEGAADSAMELRINDGLPLLNRHARQLHRRYRDIIELEELVSHGYVGLRQAAESFDASRGVPFLRYAWYRVDGEMRRAVQQQVRAAMRAREAGRQAVTLLGDDADVLHDDDQRHRRRLTEYCDAVFAAMLAGAVGQASGAVGGGYEHAAEDLDLREATSYLTQALESVDAEEAAIVRRHYYEGEQLRAIAADLGMSYATARRRHQSALTSVGQALRKLREQGRAARA